MLSRLHGLLRTNNVPVTVGDPEDSYTLNPSAVDHVFRAAASHINSNSSGPVINVFADKS